MANQIERCILRRIKHRLENNDKLIVSIVLDTPESKTTALLKKLQRDPSAEYFRTININGHYDFIVQAEKAYGEVLDTDWGIDYDFILSEKISKTENRYQTGKLLVGRSFNWPPKLALKFPPQKLISRKHNTFDFDSCHQMNLLPSSKSDGSFAAISSRQQITPGLRFEIFKRDNYRCQLCGITAQDGARLEIDHKVPISKGGASNLDNLWVLCFPCNRGKAANYL